MHDSSGDRSDGLSSGDSLDVIALASPETAEPQGLDMALSNSILACIRGRDLDERPAITEHYGVSIKHNLVLSFPLMQTNTV